MIAENKVTYEVFSVLTYGGDDLKILAPSIDLIKKLLPVKEYKIINTTKKMSSIDYVLVTIKEGNNLYLEEINSNISIDNFLKQSDLKLVRTITNYNHLMNRLEEENPDFMGKPISIGEYNSSEMTSTQEGQALKIHLNYYLERLGLKKISNLTTEVNDLFYLGTIGDAFLSYYIKSNYALKSTYSELILSNKFQQSILVHLGFIEFMSVNPHLAGTFFETIIYCAKLQNNDEFLNKILKQYTLSIEDFAKLPEYHFEEV